MEEIKLLLEDYQRRIKTVNTEIDNTDRKDIKKLDRLTVKLGCYNAFATELERAIAAETKKVAEVDTLKNEAIRLIDKENLLIAVKYVKDTTGWGLRESKDYCDDLKRKMKSA